MATANTPRACWAADYRKHRTNDALWSRFQVRLKDAGCGVPSFAVTTTRMFRFRPGTDALYFPTAPGMSHKYRMTHIARLPSGRLP